MIKTLPNTPDSRLLRHAWVRAVELFYPPPMRRPRFHRGQVTTANEQHGDASTDYVQALCAARNSGRSGATMKEILHATVVSHQRTPDICWNARSLHIPALWMTFYSSAKQCVEQWRTAV